MHTFTAAGLGQAPFQYIGMFESVYVACPGAPVQPAGSCDYCGNGIRYCFQIKSADGKISKVGCDCIKKSGDEHLAKACPSSPAKALNDSRRMAKAAAEIQAERDQNGGMTKFEKLMRDQRIKEAAIAQACQPLIAALLSDGGNFALSIAQSMQRGSLPTGRGVTIALDIISKQAGRRGSKAYESAFDAAEAAFNHAASLAP
jgi:hypothetical protein